MSIASPLRRILLAAIAAPVIALAAPAGAADAPVIVDDVVLDVELPRIMAPITVDGRLRGYAYLTIVLTPVTRDKLLLIRERVPFIQDAFLRELNRASIMMPDDPALVDMETTKRRLLARLPDVLPPDTVGELTFSQVVLAMLAPTA